MKKCINACSCFDYDNEHAWNKKQELLIETVNELQQQFHMQLNKPALQNEKDSDGIQKVTLVFVQCN